MNWLIAAIPFAFVLTAIVWTKVEFFLDWRKPYPKSCYVCNGDAWKCPSSSSSHCPKHKW